MQCEDFEQRLQQCLDDRRGPESDEALAGHASDCAECGEMLRACDALMEGLDLLVVPDPPEYLTQRVLADAVPRHVPTRNWAPSRGWARARSRLAAGAVAACVLVATVVTVYRMSPPGGEAPEPAKPAIVDTAPPADAPKDVVADRNSSPELQENLLAFTRRRAQEIWRDANVAQNRPEWLDPMSRPLIPVKDSVAAAIHAMRNALPQHSQQPDKSPSSGLRL